MSRLFGKSRQSFFNRNLRSPLLAAFTAAAAMVALAAFTPSPAYAVDPTVVLTPTSATNPVGTDHTVTAQISGILPLCNDGTTESSGAACTTDDDCTGLGESCNLAGWFIYFHVTGVNTPSDTTDITDADGKATRTYTDTNGAGDDTITACWDLDSALFTTDDSGTGCFIDIGEGGDPGDIGSDPVTKHWGLSVVLTPESDVNPFGTDHTVTVAVLDAARCTGGSNDGTFCQSVADCTDGGTCTDKTDLTVGFTVLTGPNAGTQDWGTTDSNGEASFTYTDTGGVGLDTIQACLDADAVSPGVSDEIDDLVANCIADGPSDGDFASNTVTKRWDPVVTLTPPFGFNPVGGCHTVYATVTGARKICTNTYLGLDDYNFCDTVADCNGYYSVCSLAGYPVFFAILDSCQGGTSSGAACDDDTDCPGATCGGPNVGDLGSMLTNSSGVASKNYCDTEDGEDLVQACGDLDPEDTLSLPDDSDFAMCVSDYLEGDPEGEVDIPSNTVTKDWLENFVTGGAGAPAVQLTKKKKLQFSGNVGKLNGFNLGQWNEIAEDSGKTFHCHWNSFTSIVFFGAAATTPASTHNSVTFTTGPGVCSDGSTPTATVTIVDKGEGKKVPRDTINVTSLDARLVTQGTKYVSTGNFQVHSQ